MTTQPLQKGCRRVAARRRTGDRCAHPVNLASLVSEIPLYMAYRVDEHLDTATANLSLFTQHWEETAQG